MRVPLAHGYAVRSFAVEDAEALARHANDRQVWRNLRDAFPHPYGLDDAHAFIDRVRAAPRETVFCLAAGPEAVGSIGLMPGADVEQNGAELGYWLSRVHWGRGVTTEAVRAVTDHAFGPLGLHRVYAKPYAWNAASARVLEKAGYAFEGRLRAHAFKDGQFVDQLIYGRLATDPISAGPTG